VNPVILFFIPPVVGALIGYSTNVVAVRMLFRPLREIRIFGIKLLFTPGILPRNRKKLAQSIGAMVERELLTAEIVRNRLAREDVREKIKNAISLFTEKILDKTPNELFAGHGNVLSVRISDMLEKLYPSFTTVIFDFLCRDEIRRVLESKGRILLRNIILKLGTFQRFFLSAGQYDLTLQEKMPEIIEDLINHARDTLNDEKVKNTLINAVSGSFNRIVTGQSKKIHELLNIDETDKQKLDDFIFDKLMLAADGQIESILSTINIKTLVSDRIDSLDMLKVERIILDVMSDQFKWIEIFGGLLGFLIGLFQSTVSYFIYN